ncbi:MAG: hypothetical protein SFV21_00280 [Rhodospirillaceae bacterium]|nr:hypothetical protein [Rhodospirillaceae bacterium]
MRVNEDILCRPECELAEERQSQSNKISAYQKKYYQANRTRIIAAKVARQRVWRAALNPQARAELLHAQRQYKSTWLLYPSNQIKTLVYSARSRAKRKKIEFNIEAFDRFVQRPPQDCLCCGVALQYGNKKQKHKNRSPSIDRIDNNLGYITGNVAIICEYCNRRKSDMSLADLLKIISYMERHQASSCPPATGSTPPSPAT